MIKTKPHPQPAQESERLRGIKQTCIDNLLNTTEARVYFGPEQSLPPGQRRLAFYGGSGSQCGRGNWEDGLRRLQRGTRRCCLSGRTRHHPHRRANGGEVGAETFQDRADAWVSTTKMPLRDEHDQIIGTFGISRDVTAQIKAEKALVYQALHDPVSGLANRVALMDRMSQALAALETTAGSAGGSVRRLGPLQDDQRLVRSRCR